MSDEPAYGNEGEFDEGFVRSGYVLIEEGIAANGEHAFRYRNTVPRPTALGLMQIVTDRLRYQEQRAWVSDERASEEEPYDIDNEPPDDDEDDYGSYA